MTLDELAAAFEAGQIHANTFVCREGESEWLTLAEVAGLGEEDEPRPKPSQWSSAVRQCRSVVPRCRSPQALVRRCRSVVPRCRSPASTRPPMPERRPEMTTQPAARFQPQSVPPAPPSFAAPSLSYAPVTSNLDSSLDFDELAMRPKRRWGLVLAAAAVLALAGGGTVFALNGGGSALASAIPDKAALESAAAPQPGIAHALQHPGQAQRAGGPGCARARRSPLRLRHPLLKRPLPKRRRAAAASAEDMKQALLASDKSHEKTKKAKKAKGHAATASAAPRGKGKVASGGGGFKSGGSAYDPLNGKL